jgi:hypothetical protein
MYFHPTDEDLEERARAFLKRIGLEHQVKPDLMTIIAKIKRIDPGFKYARVPDDQMPHAEAHWYSDDHCVSMRESVFIGMQRGEPRARMTVAHELCHYLLKHKGYLNRSTQKTVSEISSDRVRRQEREAKRMAAALLAPEHLVSENATAEQISEIFELSTEAAIYRVEEIARIRRRRRGEKRSVPPSIIDYLKEAKRRGFHVRRKLDD